MAAISEKDKDAKGYYRLFFKNVENAKQSSSAEEYKVIKKFAEKFREDIAYVNGFTDLPELPD